MTTNLVKELPLAEQETLSCKFCRRKEDDETLFGKFYTNANNTAHYNCLLFASSLEQKGEENEGISGFLEVDISKEIKRGKRLKCFKCCATGATVGCCDKKCKRNYHFPCGLETEMLNQYFGTFRSFCVNHRPIQKVPKSFLNGLQATCTICHEELIAKPSNDVIWAPCCKNHSWFHRDCIQRLAFSAGYFFKCPNCSDDKLFVNDMKEMGINVPDQDASWELEPDAFQELLQRHNQCDHPVCICPEGRTHDDIDEGMRWKLILCSSCGSKGLHIGCGKLEGKKSEWDCDGCCKTVGKSSGQSPANHSNTGLEAPSSSAALERPHHPSNQGYTGTSNSCVSDGVETVATTSSSCAQYNSSMEMDKCSHTDVTMKNDNTAASAVVQFQTQPSSPQSGQSPNKSPSSKKPHDGYPVRPTLFTPRGVISQATLDNLDSLRTLIGAVESSVLTLETNVQFLETRLIQLPHGFGSGPSSAALERPHPGKQEYPVTEGFSASYQDSSITSKLASAPSAIRASPTDQQRPVRLTPDVTWDGAEPMADISQSDIEKKIAWLRQENANLWAKFKLQEQVLVEARKELATFQTLLGGPTGLVARANGALASHRRRDDITQQYLSAVGKIQLE